jgi:hypothetical protein
MRAQLPAHQDVLAICNKFASQIRAKKSSHSFRLWSINTFWNWWGKWKEHYHKQNKNGPTPTNGANHAGDTNTGQGERHHLKLQAEAIALL